MSRILPAIGIDLGTSSCCVGFLNVNDHDVDIIQNQQGDRTTPSYLAYTDNHEIVGKIAKDKVSRNPKNVVYDTKRLLGRKFDDKHLQSNLTTWPFTIISGNDNAPLIEVTKNDEVVVCEPHELSSKLLSHMKQIAEAKFGKKVVDAVIAVPACFNYYQREATAEACKMAELNVLKFINEPTAAALAYVHKHNISNCNNILVFDLGGGTFDVSIVGIEDSALTVKAISGSTFLGGRDFDNNLANFIIEKLNERYHKDVRDIPTSLRRIYSRSEKIKTELSFDTHAQLDLHNIFMDGQDADFEIYRKDFENVNEHLFELCLETVKNCLNEASLHKSKIDKVLLVGGSTRIPKIQEMLADYFGGEEKLTQAINPDEAVACGAAIEAAMLRDVDKLEKVRQITEMTPFPLATDTVEKSKSFVSARGTLPPTRASSYTILDNQTEMTVHVNMKFVSSSESIFHQRGMMYL